jgi:hypothetical protein
MGLLARFYKVYIVCSMFIFSFAAVAGVYGEDAAKETGSLVEVKECEGVALTQCELAKNLILTLKMGEDLTCEACFISLRALGIAPSADWSYADPHKVITQQEIKEVLAKIHPAYDKGMVRLDTLEVTAGINSFCQGIKGPSAITPAASAVEKKKEDVKQEEIKSVPPGAQAPETQQKGGK